jgi:hypothetical protein
MKRNTKFAVPVSPDRAARVARMTEHERFIAMVKLFGLLILGLLDLIVIAWKGLPP